ncbi:MAG: M48 family metallopeptidase [Bacteroidota bacterium]|nr:M48 family metallopeptidase [Bacteroidota bacterium]
MTQTLFFGSKEIKFSLLYAERKTLGITVTSDMKVSVKAPVGTTLEKIIGKVRKKAPWIIRQQNFFLSFHPKTPARKFKGGETHLYLGRQYRLLIENVQFKNGNKNIEEIKLNGKFLIVKTKNKSPENIKYIMSAWYRKNAKQKFQEISDPIIKNFIRRHKLSNTNYPLLIREMPTRWGSCTPKGKIILNPELIKAPKRCIEYVIIHELCHLIHPDHTQKFIDLQTKEMSDWKKWKMKLEKVLA